MEDRLKTQAALYNNCKVEADDKLSIDAPGGVRVSSSGKHVCRNFGVGIAGVLIFAFVIYKLNQGAEKEKHQLKIRESAEKTKMRVDETKEKSKIRCDEYEEKLKIKYKYQQNNVLANNQKQLGLREWHETFNSKCPMPDYSAIPHIYETLNLYPEGFRPGMLLHLLSMYGALCFPKVRAKYLDNHLHTPSLQVVVEGVLGSGKGEFYHIYKTLFSKVIASDAEKLNAKDLSGIIQTTSVEASKARLMEILGNNQGISPFIIETEIDTVAESCKKSGGISTDLFRKAFSNETVTLDNKSIKSGIRGTFTVCLNFTFTGTPLSIDRFFKKESYENGTAARVCFVVIPETNNPKQKIKTLRKDKLAIMQDQIDDWRTKYCYHTDENGTDVPAKEKEIDLSYVNNELDKWICAMFFSNDQNKKNLAKRIACVAFHCAMVMHMLAGCPDTKKRNARRQIRELTIYIANYCMERYLYKSSDDKYQQFMQMKQSTMPTASKPSRKPTQAEIEHWYSLHGTLDDNGNEIGYGTIAKELGCSKDEVRNAFKRYEKTLN